MHQSTGSATVPSRLIEHFFRHQQAQLVAVLCRAYGTHRIEIIEDAVQSALVKAMQTWRHAGLPDNPAGWIHRAARNQLIDVLRQDANHSRLLALHGDDLTGVALDPPDVEIDNWLLEEQLPDSMLRMMFVCCHPSIERRSQIALLLKTLSGFSIEEIARGLLMNPETVKKRVQRARQKLIDQQWSLELPSPEELKTRLVAVHESLYLMFNEGYSTTTGESPIRDELCEEAARLCHLLCEHSHGDEDSRALLALMLFHAARFDARVADDGSAILLEDQNRQRWDHKLIAVASYWLQRAGTGTQSRYQIEAAIAMTHCVASDLYSTNWSLIVSLYDALILIADSPLYSLNRAVAIAQAGDTTAALTALEKLAASGQLKKYPLLDCAIARVHEMAGSEQQAIASYKLALRMPMAEHLKAVVETRIRQLAE